MNAELKLPPHSPEAEEFVIGALLIDNNAIDRVGTLTSDFFFLVRHQAIFAEITRQAAAGKRWDVLTVAEGLEVSGKLEDAGGLVSLGELASAVPSSANIHRHAEIVRDNYARRTIIAAAMDVTQTAYSKMPMHEALDRAQSMLQSVTDSGQSDEPRSLTDILAEHMDVMQRRLDGGVKAIPTGIDELDELLNGGWRRGNLIVPAGRPGHGKTAIAIHCGLKAAQAGYGVLCLSMEMPAFELADRAIASQGRINLGNLLRSKMDDAEWSGLTAAIGKMTDLPFHVVDRAGLNFFQVATYARRHKRKHGLDVLIIDYLQLMAAASDEKRHAQIEEITRNLKTLAKDLDIAVLLLSQLSRKTEESRRPKLSHLRDSGSIEQDADVVLFVHREEVDNPDTQWKNYADVYVAKNRQGALGRVGLTYIGEQVRFEAYANPLPDWDAKPMKTRGFE